MRRGLKMSYKTNKPMGIQALCSKCGGKVFLDKDCYGWYEHCIICGCVRDLEKVTALTGKTCNGVG